jgi:hypothetical protein
VQLNGYEYEAFVGVKRGRHPWHATFNRIDLLDEALDADFDGWIVYLDADSFVVDLKFDLAAYLKQHSDAPLIARAVVPEKAPTWNINAGVLIFNMKHPQTARLIKTWKRLLDFCCAAGLLRLPPRLAPVNDQILLHWTLRLNPSLIRAIRFEHPDFINGALFCAPTWKISSCASRSSRSACGSRSKPPGSIPRLTPPPPTAAIPVARPRRPERNRSARSCRRAARSCRSRW